MKIVVTAMPFDQGKSGISNYIQNNIIALLKQGHELIIYAFAEDQALLEAALSKIQSAHYHWRIVGKQWASPMKNILWHATVFPLLLKREQAEGLFLPAGNRRALPHYALPTVCTVHDLSQFHIEHKYSRPRMFYIQKLLPQFLKRAPQLMAISESTRQDLVRHYKLNAQDIRVNPNGFERERFGKIDKAQAREMIKQHWGIDKKYLLYIARIEHPGKNHMRLLQAYAQLPDEIQAEYKLLFAGADWNGAEVVHQAITDMGLADNVKCLGFVPADMLAPLYAGCEAYLFPSLYEGFGLPMLEAMASGVPVISSNRSSLPEVGGNAALYFDPENPEEMAMQIQNVLQQPHLKHEMIQAGLERVKEFSWENHSAGIVEMLNAQIAKGSFSILGQKLNNFDMPRAINTVNKHIITGQPARIFYLNADCLNISFHDPQYREDLNAAEYRFPDGSGIKLASLMTGQSMRENINGTDMLPKLCALAEKKQYRLYFYGAQPGVAEAMASKLLERYPNLKICGVAHGFLSLAEEAALIKDIQNQEVDMLFVAKGAPLQERWISEHFDALNVPVVLGVGGLFDFYAERVSRAPKILRKTGLEWCWRMAQEPQRLWKRYLLGNPQFLWRVARFGKYMPGVRKNRQQAIKATDTSKSCLNLH